MYSKPKTPNRKPGNVTAILAGATDGVSASARTPLGADATTSPYTNRGGKSEDGDLSYRLMVKDAKGKPELVLVPVRFGYNNECSFVDWVEFTIHEDYVVSDLPLYSSEDYASVLSAELFSTLGYGVIDEPARTGLNFYQKSFGLGDKYGFLQIGGNFNRGTIHIVLSGAGCAAAAAGWESRLCDFIKKHKGKLTRIDLAYDDYDGIHKVETTREQYLTNQFNMGGRNPKGEAVGEWDYTDGTGKTYYVGRREGAKMLRHYEKGKQLGDKESPWTRLEVQFRNKDKRHLPLDMLMNATGYLAASYPVLAWIAEESQQFRIACIKKTTEITYDKMKFYAKQQAGKALRAIFEIEGVNGLMTMLHDDIPARLAPPNHTNLPESAYLHKNPKPKHEYPDGFIPGFDDRHFEPNPHYFAF